MTTMIMTASTSSPPKYIVYSKTGITKKEGEEGRDTEADLNGDTEADEELFDRTANGD